MILKTLQQKDMEKKKEWRASKREKERKIERKSDKESHREIYILRIPCHHENETKKIQVKMEKERNTWKQKKGGEKKKRNGAKRKWCWDQDKQKPWNCEWTTDCDDDEGNEKKRNQEYRKGEH